MKNILSLLILLISSISFASQITYTKIVDLSQHKGRTYFSLMREVIKPALDQMSTDGFDVVSGQQAVAALKKVDNKVASGALRAAGSVYRLKQVADSLASEKRKFNFYDLPQVLGQNGIGSGRFDLSTYLALVSGGGVAVQIDNENIAYNVNYGSGNVDKDEMTGRSFGEAPGRLALDASDKHYLQILEAYVRGNSSNVEHFYRSILAILLNSDASEYSQITRDGQAVATDFIAVYTAEQDRHLMANLRSHAWDEALLEVTLLSSFHAGQDKIKLMYNGTLTDTTLKQAPGCNTEARQPKKASLTDYWQFSKSTDPANCNRSGLNVGRKDFRSLGAAITSYHRQKNPDIVARVERHFKSSKNRGNLFAQLSNYLINFNTPSKLEAEDLALIEDFTAFLMKVKADADTTDQFIVSTWHGLPDSDTNGDN